MPRPTTRADIYAAIAQSLREFGYDHVRPDQIKDTHEAMIAGTEIPHGVIGLFAKDQLQDCIDQAEAMGRVF